MPAEKSTLITGGNKGLGYETARRLAAGHSVYIGARNPVAGQAAADELGAGFVRLDVTDDESVTAAAAELERREGRIDVLINNAGITGPGKEVPDLTGADASVVFDTNVAGIVRVTHAFLPLLGKSPAPVIVNVSSGVGSFAVTHDPARLESGVRSPLYAASKAAITMLTTQYAKALPHIRINAPTPGSPRPTSTATGAPRPSPSAPTPSPRWPASARTAPPAPSPTATAPSAGSRRQISLTTRARAC